MFISSLFSAGAVKIMKLVEIQWVLVATGSREEARMEWSGTRAAFGPGTPKCWASNKLEIEAF